MVRKACLAECMLLRCEERVAREFDRVWSGCGVSDRKAGAGGTDLYTDSHTSWHLTKLNHGIGRYIGPCMGLTYTRLIEKGNMTERDIVAHGAMILAPKRDQKLAWSIMST